MRKAILCIDDSNEQLVQASIAVRSAGKEHRFLPIEIGSGSVEHVGLSDGAFQDAINLMNEGTVNGVITDLYFNPRASSMEELPPAGLLIVIHALSRGIPVVVCTRCLDFVGNHHSKEMGWIADPYMNTSAVVRSKVGWIEDKDWERALQALEEMMNQ